MTLKIRRAQSADREGVLHLLRQIAEYHREGRPDLFKAGSAKYSKEEFEEIIKDKNKPVFVATDKNNTVLGYIFCVIKSYKSHAIFNDYNTLYIDDFCVDENVRGQHIGRQLFETVKNYAKEIKVYNITLNVWEFNESAKKFYESCGLFTQRREMEVIL